LGLAALSFVSFKVATKQSIKHWTPRYLVDRSLNMVSERLHPDWPWLTPQAVQFLELWLRPTDRVFEWGSGRSTLWIAHRVRAISSVEDDPVWFQWGRAQASRQALRNIDLKFRVDPKAYAAAIQELAEDFDLIVVDGQEREKCALAAISRLKPGGILLVDDAQWFLPSRSRTLYSRSLAEGPASPEWAEFARHVADWRLMWATNGVHDTVMWVKPACR
jgi:SAM-dependent methyltransferase